MEFRCFHFAALAIVLAVPPAAGETVNRVRFGSGGLGASLCAEPGYAPEFTSAGQVFQAFSTSSESGFCQQLSYARAGGGSVGVSSNMQADRAGVPRVDVTAESTFDVELSVPERWTGGLVPLALVAEMAAELSAAVDSRSPFGRGAAARLRAEVGLSGYATEGGSARTSSTNIEDYAASGSNSGVPFGNLSVLELIGTNTLMVDPTRPVRVTFRLDAGVGGQIYSDSSSAPRSPPSTAWASAPACPSSTCPRDSP